GLVVHRIQTDKGELVIQADRDVEIVVRRGGEEVELIDTKTRKRVTLRSGTYDLELKGNPEGLKLDIVKATLKRGDRGIAKIERVVPAGKLPPAPVAAPGPIRRFVGNSACVGAVDISPDGRFALTGAPKGDDDCALQLWDIATGEKIRRFKGHRSSVLHLAFS